VAVGPKVFLTAAHVVHDDGAWVTPGSIQAYWANHTRFPPLASAERAGETPDAHLERLLGPALDAEEECHPSKTEIRIARGIGIVLAALALAMLVYVVQSGDLITGIVVLAFATLAGRFLLWPAFENGLNNDVGRKEIWGGFHRCMYDEWNDERRNEDLSQPVPGGLGPYSEFVYGRDSSDD